jgi:hypothetical protein
MEWSESGNLEIGAETQWKQKGKDRERKVREEYFIFFQCLSSNTCPE